MSKRSELRAVNRAKKKNTHLPKEVIEEQILEAERVRQKKYDEEEAAHQAFRISHVMREYSGCRRAIIGFLTGEGPYSALRDGKALKSAKCFLRGEDAASLHAQQPFQIEHTMRALFLLVSELCSKFRSVQDIWLAKEKKPVHYYIEVDIDNILNTTIEYFPRMGLEDHIAGVRLLFDERQKQLQLIRKWESALKLAKSNPHSRAFCCFTSAAKLEMLVERFYNENKAEIDVLSS